MGECGTDLPTEFGEVKGHLVRFQRRRTGLNMQVVRASNNRNLWQEVHREGSATVNYDASAVAREMIDAVNKKSGNARRLRRKS